MSTPHRSSARYTRLAGLLISLPTLLAVVGCAQQPIVKLRQSGEFHFRYGDYEAAAEDFGAIIDRAPGDWEAQYRYGQCMLQLGELDAARRALEIAAISVPNDDQVAFALAEVYFRQGDQTRLYQLLRDRAASTGSAEPWVLLSSYALRLDDPDTANTAALAAIEVDNGASAVPYYQAALVAQRLGQTDLAVRRLRQGYGINPNDTRIRTMLVELGEVPGPTIALPPGR
ncbi:MAG TPA: tetratricopeptide repeat protein [Phycisphaerales bacterium]|nr:tetratricopeptide repeat protein [Phycisphaerales bacterium]HMP36773.1 tetratricopeptide repeat protein [Phycisphaerales bacterium]